MRRKWTKEELEYVKLNYSDRYTKDIAAVINRSDKAVYQAAMNLNVKKSPEFIKIFLKREAEKLKVLGVTSRFKPGNVSHNKGQKMSKELYERVKVSMFKKGNEPHNMKYDGHERLDPKDGYVYIRIAKAKYVLKHRLVWEQHNGPIPKGNIIVFKDKDKYNITIDNLQMISKRENMLRNTVTKYPLELQQLIKLNNKLKTTLHEKQN
jgi:HNH endonuclease